MRHLFCSYLELCFWWCKTGLCYNIKQSVRRIPRPCAPRTSKLATSPPSLSYSSSSPNHLLTYFRKQRPSQVIQRTHDPRFDPEIKEIAQKGVKHLHRTSSTSRSHCTTLLPTFPARGVTSNVIMMAQLFPPPLGFTGTYRARTAQTIASAYTTIPAPLLCTYLGFPDPSSQELQSCKCPGLGMFF